MGPSLVALLLFLASPASPAASPAAGEAARAPDPAHLAELLGRARRAGLWEDPGWLRLGHWRRTRKGGFESEVDGTPFFRALRGRTDPRAELEATLRAFFDDRPVADELSDAQCRYPARFAFLAGRLGVDLARLPPRRCPRFEAFLERIRPRSATLVFSSYYLNNPASAFGHTFLRFNKDDAARAGREWELLDYGVDYSATVDTKNAVLYAVKGLLGLFRGQFNHYAYYYKVREYADAESRDLWEYDLALAPGEVALLAAHLWELGGTYFDYWYLDENCSYHVLGALEAAAPRLSLLEHVGRHVVIPADTVKALFRNPGLVRGVHYRPSIRTQFVTRLGRLDPAGRAGGGRARGGPGRAAPGEARPGGAGGGARRGARPPRPALRPRPHRGEGARRGALPSDAARAPQRGRRRLAPARPSAAPVPRAPARPRLRPRRPGGRNLLARDGALVLLDLRLALHDLGDPADGYPPLSQIEFLPTRLRLAPREGRAEVDEAWFVRVVSLNDLTRFELRPSWRLRFGAATVRDAGCAACLAGQAELGAGFAKTLGPLDLFAGADLVVEGSPRLDGTGGRSLRLGVGPGGLVRLRLGAGAVLLGDARWRWLPDTAPRETFEVRAALRLHLAKDLSLALEARRTPAADEGTLALHAFY